LLVEKLNDSEGMMQRVLFHIQKAFAGDGDPVPIYKTQRLKKVTMIFEKKLNY
jgi:hypothetical protein